MNWEELNTVCWHDLPADLVMVSLSLPNPGISQNALIAVLESLPAGWNAHPPAAVSQQIGKDFIEENKYLALKVPSVTVRGDYNYLLNPLHPQFDTVETLSIEPFFLDERLGEKS